MKKVEFNEMKVGEYFKRYRRVYIKIDSLNAVDIRNGHEICIWNDTNVIPVIVTIKAKEK